MPTPRSGSKVLERAAGHACGPYKVANVDVESHAVMTNNPPCGAMRGFGANQAHFGIEGALDLLAEQGRHRRLGDSLAQRTRGGRHFSTGQVLEKSVGIKQTLEAVKDSYYSGARAAGRRWASPAASRTAASATAPMEWGRARLVVEDDGTVSLYNGYTEMGQGLLTILVQCAVEVTGLPASVFDPRVDSTFELDCAQTTGSRATLFGGRAVRDAALDLAADLDGDNSLADLVGKVYAAEVLIEDTTPPGADALKVKTHTSFGFATQVVILDDQGRVDRVVAAHDVGRAINRRSAKGRSRARCTWGSATP